MKKVFTFIIAFGCLLSGLFASAGDTTSVRVFDKFSMNRYGSFDKKVKLPDASKKYQRIWLKYTLGCESNGQCEWDYTVKLHMRQHTGKNDSTLKQAPFLKVNGTIKDSLRYSVAPTWTNTFNNVSKQTDSMLSATILVSVYADSLNPLMLTDSFRVYPADYYRYWFDSTGKKSDSVLVVPTNTVYQKYTSYYEIFEVVNNFELGRFISPYAKTFPKNFQYEYVYDVTDYVSLFNQSDSTELRIEYQGYSYGFTATWDMVYIEGTPAREVIAIDNIYNGGFNYGQTESIEVKLNARQFTVPEGANATKARIIITGHGGESSQNCAEFCAKNYYLKLNNTQVAEKLVWKDDCGSNAIAAQPGTWVYNRANWCPGEKTRYNDHWLNVASGSNNTIDMDMEQFTASGGASYNISMLLFHYKAPAHQNDASIEDVIAPSKDQWHNRYNPICDNAKITIKNKGSNRLTRALISFKIGDGNLRVQEWAGDLGYDEETEVSLPYIDWPAGITDTTFKVWLSSVNGMPEDENVVNNVKHSAFITPPVLPAAFILETRTNNAFDQNSYTITDAFGKVHYNRNFDKPATTYKDTINLGFGCYTLKFTDAGGNGINWWAAASEGAGFVRLRPMSGSSVIKTFNPDFGNFIQYSFRAQYAVGVTEVKAHDIKIFPNPASDILFIEGIVPAKVIVNDITGKLCLNTNNFSNGIDVKNLPAGVYVLSLITREGETFTRKISIIK